MSLMSLLTSNPSTYGYGASVTGVTGAAPTVPKTTAPAAAGTANSASISVAARIAAAEKTDNAKDFMTLSGDVRAALDAGYAASGTKTPDLSEMSGRALSAIILDKTASFSCSEQAAARAELQQRTRHEFTTALSSGSGLTALTGYNQLLVSAYDSISPEEREARGWTAALRSSAQTFVDSTSAASTGNSSLFELLNGDDQDDTRTMSFF